LSAIIYARNADEKGCFHAGNEIQNNSVRLFCQTLKSVVRDTANYYNVVEKQGKGE
jgi:hypothetical protein